jgi:hypothetical protein
MIDISAFESVSTGGCEIETYEIQMDDGLGGAYESMVGYSQPYLTLWYINSEV